MQNYEILWALVTPDLFALVSPVKIARRQRHHRQL